MDLTTAKLSTRALIQSLSGQDQDHFMKWIKRSSVASLTSVNSNNEHCGDENVADAAAETFRKKESLLILEGIRQDLQSALPPNCLLESECIRSPQGSDTCGDDHSSVHVDSFVYDEDDLDIACERGLLSRSYCVKCGSKDIKGLDFISHSFSVDQVKFISQHLLSDSNDKVLLDIGSRTGALLYGACLLSPVKLCIGVEMNKEFADLSNSLIRKYNMSDRVSVLSNDILNCARQIQKADIVVMNNVFELFKDEETQTRLWRFCLDEIRRFPGRILITVPEVSKSLSHLKMSYDLSFLQSISTNEKADRYLEQCEEAEEKGISAIMMYRVL